MLQLDDPLNFLKPLPSSIQSLYLELENPPRLSTIKKIYYLLRPFIPLKVRRILQGNRKINIPDDWFITNKLLMEYLKYCDIKSVTDNIWPNEINSPFVLTHDVETAEGFKFIPKILELEHKYKLRSSWNIVPYLYPIDNGIINLIKEYNCEIGIHGYNHDGKLYFSKWVFNKRKPFINAAIQKYGAVGFRSPAVHRNLLWLQELDIQYDASCFDIDPFQPMPGGTHSIWPFKVGKFVELPYTLPQDHVVWIQLKEKTNKIWEEKLRWLYDKRGMMLIITHPDYIMMEDNLNRYEDFLQYALSFEKIKNYLPCEITQYWNSRINMINENEDV